MSYTDLAKKILDNVGGEQNVMALEHCATRLRFNLKDESQANSAVIESLPGVVSVINKGGQYQVVIGNEVIEVFNELVKLGDFANSADENGGSGQSMVNRILDTISGIFFPIVPALAGAGMLKALLSVLVVTKLVSNQSASFQILNFMGDAGFYFMPVIIAASAAKKFKVNQYVAMAIGAMLLHPAFINMVATAKEAGVGLKLLGIPVPLVSYGSSVIPIILAIWLMSYVEPVATRYTPKSMRIIMVPLLEMLVVGVATLALIGPLGFNLGKLLGDFINFVNAYASWLVPLLVGTFTPLMVMTGMHYGLIPIGINMLATTGFDTVAGPGMMVSNIAQGGAALAVAIRAKSIDIKSLATSAGISAIVGITEPAMYGISLRFKRPLIAAMAGGGAAGLFIGVMGVGRYAQVAPGLFALPSFIGGDSLNNFIYAIVGCVIAFVVSFGVSFVLGIEEPQEKQPLKTAKEVTLCDEEIYAPISGKVISLENVGDPVFSSGALGKGVAIVPDNGRLYAPADGEINFVFATGHAIGLTSGKGAQILIHVGFDTVNLKGEHFTPKVKAGQSVKRGDLLLEFDIEKIKENFDITTPIVITNHNQYGSIDFVKQSEVKSDEPLLVLSI